jgi:Bacterial archaeo-eukaryotic release factor family 2
MSVLTDNFLDLVSVDAPIASVYLRGTGTSEDAGHRFDTRWKNARRDLAAAGAPDAVIAELERAIDGSSELHAPSLALFANESAPAIVEPLDDELADDLVAFDGLPRLVPLLHARQRSLPHLMVMTDRTGADVVAVVDGAQVDAESVEGTTHHIHRGRFGGWSHRRIQQRVENRWEENAKDVADQVSTMARDIDARVIAISGDVRACQLLMDQLDDAVAELATVLDVGDPDDVADTTVRLVADAVARDTRALLSAERDDAGSARGVGPVLSALTAGRVRTLLVVDDAADDRRAWYANDGSPVCSMRKSYEDMTEGRLVDVAVRSALLSDSDIRVVPATTVDDDLGAILRW